MSRATSKRRELDLAKAGALLREAGFVGSEADPVSATGLYRDGRIWRVDAAWDGGWRATCYIRKDGTVTLTSRKRLGIWGVRG